MSLSRQKIKNTVRIIFFIFLALYFLKALWLNIASYKMIEGSSQIYKYSQDKLCCNDNNVNKKY